MLGWMSIKPKTNTSQYFGALAKPSLRKNHASRDPSVEHQDTLLRDGRSQVSTQGARRVLQIEFLASPEDVRRRPKYTSGSVRLVASLYQGSHLLLRPHEVRGQSADTTSVFEGNPMAKPD
jgi:hypothetical protein